MRTKVFFQKSVILYFALLLFLAIMGLCIYVAVTLISQGIDTLIKWIYLISAIGGFIFIAYLFIRFARNRIVLKYNEIYIPEHWGNNKQKIQFETHVKYTEISNIYLIEGSNNSLNKESKFIFTPMPYIIFECEDGIKKAVNVFYYSKKQVIKIIDEVINRAKLLNNNRLLKSGNEIFLEFKKSINK